MARRNQFDKAIKDKMQGLQAEPSAKVWAGIREAVPGDSSPGKGFYLKAVTVLLLIGLAGSAWWYFSGNTTTDKTGGKQLTQRTNPTIEKPTDNAIETVTPPATETLDNETPADNALLADKTSIANREPLSSTNTQTVNRKKSLRTKPQSQVSDRTEAPLTNQEIAKENNTPDPQPTQEIQMTGIEGSPQEVQLKDVPVQQPDPTLQEVIAREDAEEKDGQVEEQEDVEGESKAGRKRRLDLANLDSQKIKSRTGTVLSNLAQGAGEAIGIKTDVKKTETDEQKTKKVTVKFGPLKFKRVRNTDR